VFYSGEAEKISPHSKGLLTYELGKEGETGSLALRLTANGEGGLFSREWIALDAIHAILEQQQTAFRPVYFAHCLVRAAPITQVFLLLCSEVRISALSKRTAADSLCTAAMPTGSIV
jgi:hypothetical protein